MQHPREVGFRKVATILIRPDGIWQQSNVDDGLLKAQHLIYAFTDHAETVFRVGQTGKRLNRRLDGYRKLTKPGCTLKDNEMMDARKLRHFTRDMPFAIWAMALEPVSGFYQSLQARIVAERRWRYYYEPQWDREFGPRVIIDRSGTALPA